MYEKFIYPNIFCFLQFKDGSKLLNEFDFLQIINESETKVELVQETEMCTCTLHPN